MSKFISKPNQPNQILSGEDFYISYNLKTGIDSDITRASIAILAAIFSGNENGKEETALCGPNGKWYILNGDFRLQYEEAFPNGFDACFQVYKRNIQHRSEWSTDNVDDYQSVH